MAGKRTPAKDLVRLLNSAPQPIYALDEDLTIIFLNPACREWLGPASEGLIGARCAYHAAADPTSPEAVAAGLCPPPEAISGKNSAAVVVCLQFSPLPMGEGQGVRADSPDNLLQLKSLSEDAGTLEKHRRAEFIPLGLSGELRGILAILESEDSPAAIAECEASSAKEPCREELHAAIRRFRREAAGRCSADHLIGISPAMQLARRQVAAAAASGCSVCVAGPPGSGRERLAAAIHYASNPEDAKVTFAQSGMISLDCSVLPAELILSTLAALARSHSAAENAVQSEPATLLLNRVDELPAELQAELSALLTKKRFPRRLICTAAAPLGELAQRGNFRADLAALLSTIGILLPPLNQRREDLPLLSQIFLEDCNRQRPKQVGCFSPAALDKLDAYAWPGNLDELAAIVAAAHRNAAGAEIAPEELPSQIHLAAQAAAHPRRTEEPIRLDEFLERVERELIRRALARAKGNKAKAARLLGLTRPRLYRRMVQLGLEAD
jgi:DNA-binding NtrC family response regulator